MNRNGFRLAVVLVASLTTLLSLACGDDDDSTAPSMASPAGGATATQSTAGGTATATVRSTEPATGVATTVPTTPTVAGTAAGPSSASATPKPPATATQVATTPPTLAATSVPVPVGTATAPVTASRELLDVLTDAIKQEYKLRASYQAVLDKLGAVAPFVNIVSAENGHIEAWTLRFSANGFTVPADTFAGTMVAPTDKKAACVAGVASEMDVVALFTRLMAETTDTETLKVLEQQRTVSQENHLPAFQNCAE